MFLKGFNEHHIGNTSLFSVKFSLSIDILSSVINPNEVFVCNLDLAFNVFSVSGRFISSSLVGISDKGKVGNLFSKGFFLSSVKGIRSSLRIKVCLLKIS